MILIDTNLLVYAVDASSRMHDPAREWLETQFNGPTGVALPWQSLNGFARLISNPRVCPNPMSTAEAWTIVEEWLNLDVTFTPEPTRRHREVLSGLMAKVTRAELIPDAHLAALAMEYGLRLCSTDSDFDRFPGLPWTNPLSEPG